MAANVVVVAQVDIDVDVDDGTIRPEMVGILYQSAVIRMQ